MTAFAVQLVFLVMSNGRVRSEDAKFLREEKVACSYVALTAA